MQKARFRVFKGKDGQWHFNLVAANGKVVLQSEAYHNRKDAIKTIEGIQHVVAEENGQVAVELYGEI